MLNILRICGAYIGVKHLLLGGLHQTALAHVLILLGILQGLCVLVLVDEVLQWLILQGLEALLHIVLTQVLI